MAYKFEYIDVIMIKETPDIIARGSEIRNILYYLTGSSILNILVLIFLFKSKNKNG